MAEETGLPPIDATVAGDANAAQPRAPATAPDPSLVEQTRREIQQIASEISDLARQDLLPAEFYARYLPAVVSALGALGGAVWKVGEAGELTLEFQVNFASARLDDDQRRLRHTLLLRNVVSDGKVIAVPPHSGSSEEGEAGNPTDHLLLLAPLTVGSRVVSVVEIFQRSDTGPATQRGYCRFLSQMADTAAGYLKSRSLQKYSDRQQLWQQLEQYISLVHESLDPRTTAYTIANEGRRLIGCDRVSVLLRKGSRYRMEAISGVDNADTRAVHVRFAEKLVTAASATGEPLWYRGDARDVPPQIEDALQSLIDETHAHTVGIVPLRPISRQSGDVTEEGESLATPLGALLIEQFQDDDLGRGFAERVQAVADHGSAALASALAHHSIFLLWLWKWLGNLRLVIAARNLPKTALALGGTLAVVATLTLVPANFELEGRGKLEPTTRRDVFAGIEGKVIEVPLAHGEDVEVGTVLAKLRSTSDLDVAVADLVGKKLAARERVAALERELLGNQASNPEVQDRLSGELFQLNKTVESIEKQLELYEQKQQQLTITSPIRGQLVTWQVREKLLHRPVRQGQALMTVVDPSGQWELEVEMPQRRIGHIKQAAENSDEPLPVVFMLATHPGQEFTGHVKEIGQVVDTSTSQETTVVVRVAIDKVDLPELRPGTTVTARVVCGRCPLGYVWLHDVIEFVQSQVLFRL